MPLGCQKPLDLAELLLLLFFVRRFHDSLVLCASGGIDFKIPAFNLKQWISLN
jgi:hypothetical protein